MGLPLRVFGAQVPLPVAICSPKHLHALNGSCLPSHRKRKIQARVSVFLATGNLRTAVTADLERRFTSGLTNMQSLHHETLKPQPLVSTPGPTKHEGSSLTNPKLTTLATFSSPKLPASASRPHAQSSGRSPIGCPSRGVRACGFRLASIQG